MSKSSTLENLDDRVRDAVRQYWSAREVQTSEQAKRGAKDQGARGAVTGGKQMDGFVRLVRDFLVKCGIFEKEIFLNSGVELPGYFRPTKKWDVVVVRSQRLVAAIELKSIGSSFGNNLNSRVEESIGSAQDILTAYREGAIPAVPRPWLGYLMLFVESDRSTHPVKVAEPHFEVFPEFKTASYVERGRIMLTKLVRERLYDGTCLVLAKDTDDSRIVGRYTEPDAALSIRNFLIALCAQVEMATQLR